MLFKKLFLKNVQWHSILETKYCFLHATNLCKIHFTFLSNRELEVLSLALSFNTSGHQAVAERSSYAIFQLLTG